MLKKFFLSILFLSLLPFNVFSDVKISGIILGWDEKPLPLAHCHVQNIGDAKLIYSYPTNKDGRFWGKIPWDGYVKLYFTGVNHHRDSVIIFVPKDYKEIKIKVRLSPNIWKEGSKLTLSGNYLPLENGKKLELIETNDGKFFADVRKGPEALKYEICGIVPQRCVNGTSADYYEYDNDGDYYSVLATKDTIVRVVFDPKVLPTNPVDFKFQSEDPFINRIANLYYELNQKRIEFMDQRDTLIKKQDFETLKKIINDRLKRINALLKQSNYTQEKELLLIDNLAYSFIAFSFNSMDLVDTNLLKNVYHIVPPTSLLWMDWATEPGLMLGGLLLLGRTDSTSYVDSAITYHPSTFVRRKILRDAVDLYLGMNFNNNKGYYYFDELIKKYPQSPQAKSVKDKYQRNFDSLYDYWANELINYTFYDYTNSDTVRLRSLIGNKYVLIDFWATWCTPCILSMKSLDRLPKELKDKITIISVALDDKNKALNYIREKQKKNELKWLHSIEEKGFVSPIAKLFNIKAIPFMVVLNKEGKIIFCGEIGYFLLEEKLRELVKF